MCVDGDLKVDSSERGENRMLERKTVTLEEFIRQLKSQDLDQEDAVFICPVCKTPQSAADLIAAGAGENFDSVETYLGFSCVGRWLNAGSGLTPKGKVKKKEPASYGCNWTLGGLFQLHELEVVDDEGKAHPRFVPASPEVAKIHFQGKEARVELLKKLGIGK